MDHSLQGYSFGATPDTSGTLTGVTQQNSTSPLNTSGTSSHFYQRVGIGMPQQSPVFNSLISGQGQSLYSGVYSSQSGFTNQNSFSPAAFNGCLEAPMWFPDSRVSVSSNNNNVPLTENGRISRNQYIDKNLLCCSNRIGVLENIGMCSPLSSETYKISSKDFSSVLPKNAGLIDSSNWLCSQGVAGFGNQQSQHIGLSLQQSNNFKCNEQFSSCSVSQINVSLPEQGDFKHHSNSFNPDNSCFLAATQNQLTGNSTGRSTSKHNSSINHCENETHKSGYHSKEHVTKYPCSLQKHTGLDGQQGGLIISATQPKQTTDQNLLGNSTSMYMTTHDAHEYTIYSQPPLVKSINETVQPSKKHSNIPSHQNNLNGQFPLFQQHFHDPGVACDPIDSCFQLDSKSNLKYSNSHNLNSGTNRSCCNLGVNCEQHVFPSNSPCISRQSLHCLSEGLASSQLNSKDTPQLSYCQNEPMDRSKITILMQMGAITDDFKENVNEESSVAGESDIIVEETEDETESEISIDESKLEASVKCLVCDTIAISQNSTHRIKFVNIDSDKPKTSSHVPILHKLTQIIPSIKQMVGLLGISTKGFICKTCLNLTDCIDSLETKLASMKQDLVQRYSRQRKEALLAKFKEGQADSTKIKILEEKFVIESIQESPLVNSSVVLECETSTIKEIETKEKVSSEKNRHFRSNGNTKDLTSHLSKIDKEKTRHQCLVCSKYFSSETYLDKHRQSHTKEFSFYCEHCGRGFMLRRILENHLSLHKGEFQYQCEICGKLFIQRFNLETHIRKHYGDYRVKCDQCGKGFMSSTSLKIHLVTHSLERPFICQHCGKSFGTNSNLISHVNICAHELTFDCDICLKKFPTKARLRNHILSQHEGNFRTKCTVCGKGFLKESDCKAHMVTHSLEKNHKCLICGKCYKSLGNLNQHAKKHDKERPFKCNLCEQGFLRKSSFINHMNKHSGLRPFPCDQCSKTFTLQKNLLEHRKWHAGTLKRYVCTVCGKTFRHGLEVHMRTHSGLKPYKCLQCDMAFSVKSSLNKHTRCKH